MYEEYELIPELEMLLNKNNSYYPGRMYEQYSQGEYENGNTSAETSPKTVWLHNTELNGPCFAGNINFLYNGGANEATATYNTKISFRENFSVQQKNNFINNLQQAAATWDNAAEIQVKDIQGNFSQRIRLRFKLNIVTDSNNANKITDVHAAGTRAIPVVMGKDREVVSREMNVFINSEKNVLVHELGHVWGLSDEYKDGGVWGWLTMKFSPCHVGSDSPLVQDKMSIMNQGYTDAGEFRTRFFAHFGRAILDAFWGLKNYIHPVIYNGRTMARTIQGRVVLLKKNIAGAAPYTTDTPFNPQFTYIQVAKRN